MHTEETVAQFFLSNEIPFVMGGSEVYGADCVGLVLLYCKLVGRPFAEEQQIPRGHGTFDLFKSVLNDCGCVPDERGIIVLERFIGYAHIGLYLKGFYVNQNNSYGRTIVTEGLPNNAFLYSLPPIE